MLQWRLHGAGLHHRGQEQGHLDLVHHRGVVAAHGEEDGGAHAVTNVTDPPLATDLQTCVESCWNIIGGVLMNAKP